MLLARIKAQNEVYQKRTDAFLGQKLVLLDQAGAFVSTRDVAIGEVGEEEGLAVLQGMVKN